METKDTLSSCSNSEAQQMQQIQDKSKRSFMVSFRQLHSHLKRLSQNELNGTRIESGFKHAFATLFGQDVETFIGTMFLNVEQLEKKLDKEDSQEIRSMTAFNVLETQFHMFITSRIYLDDEYSNDERGQHKREYDNWVNERQMQTTKEKVDTSKALDASLVDTESSGTESKEHDTSSRSGNDAHADDADIRSIYDEEPMAEGFKEFSTDEQVMTSDHNSSELEIHDYGNEQSSSKMVPKVVPSAYKTATSRQKLELLFHNHITMLRSTWISAGKEVDIGLGGGCDKALRLADMLVYSWDGGLNVCVDLTGSSPLTQTGMADFVPGRAVIDAAQRKRGKYMAKYAAIEYGFLLFFFSSLGELDADAVTLLKRIQKFSMAQDIGARVAVHIFNMISFSIAKGNVEFHIYEILKNFISFHLSAKDIRNKRTSTGGSSTSFKEDEPPLNDAGSTVEETYEGYVLPDLPGLEKDFWEGPEWDGFGFVVEYLWAFGIVFALVSSGIAVATYNEGATDFKETPAYKESIQSRDLLEEPEASSPDVFESNPTEEAPSLE
uniref:Uncharacterized protein n=1 Tax=Tanacetum cinerariifolium TaxID=118510 RepID=A0A6L2MBQ4_TANCI|nr:hypothetical protein CTI12_AA376980 [Tanacetum cinerariifolium]